MADDHDEAPKPHDSDLVSEGDIKPVAKGKATVAVDPQTEEDTPKEAK